MLIREQLLLKSDLERGFYFLQGEVDEELFTEVCEAISIMEQVKCEEVTLAIKSVGGDLYTGLAIYDRIKMSSKRVNTLAIGECMSAGSLILQAGDRRYATKYAQIMVHAGFESLSGTPEETEITRKHFRKLQGQMADIYVKRASVTERTIKNWLKKDTYFTAEEALEKSLIDEVIG